MATASAKPGKLQAFVDAAAEIRGELSTRITELRASYDSFQESGSSYVGNPELMTVVLPDFITNYQNDETFVAVVRQAFLDADVALDADGVASVDAATFSTAFDAAARAAGIDPAALVIDRAAVTVDAPIAAGTPATSGFVADPVCTATGHFLEVEEDLTWPDRLGLLRWRRTYSSRFVVAGPFGRGWASWASVALVVDPDDGAVGYQGPDGQMAVFTPSLAAADPPGTYARISGIAATLTRARATGGGPDGRGRPDGDDGDRLGWVLTWDRHSERPGAAWSFDADGLLRTVSDPTAGTVAFSYTGGLLTAVEHEGRRRLHLDWDGARVVAVRSSCGRSARYHYDDAGDLARTERVLGDRRYETDGAGRVVEVWDADGVRLCRNTYDDEGRVLSQVSPFGRETVFRYHPGNRTVVSDTDDGPVSIFEHDAAGRLVGLVDHQGHRMARRFDAAGRCVEATGFDGATAHQQFSADGLSAERTSPGGAAGERWEYDEQGRVVAHEVVGGRRMTFDYDGDGTVPSRLAGPDGWEVRVEAADGLVKALTDADGVTVRVEHDGDGNVVSTSNALGATTTTVPHVSGLAARTTLPDGSVLEVDRDDAGRMLALRSPLGAEHTLRWSPAGRLVGMTDPAGAQTRFEHGAHGAVERVVDALGATLELTHDHLERLVGLAAPGGAKWEFGYSGVGLLSLVHDPAGGTWGYEYDAEGRMVAATDPLGHQARSAHDAAGRVAELIDPAGNATRYTRDALGRVVAVDRPEGATTTFSWDAWGRPVTVAFPDGDTFTYGYTPAGRLRSVTTAEGRGWTSDYDRAGRLVAVTDATGATTRFTWDVCDRLVETVTPTGHRERAAYDAAGRMVETTRAGRTWRVGYDHAGRVTAVTDPVGGTRRYRYDPRGKLVAATDALGNTVRIRYDERGNPTGVLDPFGGLSTTTYDAMRRPVAVTDQLGRVTRVRRDAAGRVVARELPTGDLVEWRRDPNGRATDVLLNGRDVIVFDRDGAGRPVLVHEPARNRTFTFAWTRAGRLASLDVDGATMRWGHDRDGLVTSRTDHAGRATTYARDAAGRLSAVSSDRWGTVELDRDLDGRVVALRAEGVTREWSRDAGGLVAAYREVTRWGDSTTALERDASGRVVSAASADGTSRYTYDAAGQLVAASTPTGAWTWRYDAAGRLVREDGPDGRSDYHYDQAHQLVRIDGPAGTTGFTYDAAGRRTVEQGPSRTRSFSWDGLGRLNGIDDGTAHTLDVDALGNLAAVDDTPLTWDPVGPVPEIVSVGDREVVTAGGHPLALADGDGAVAWLGADWRGSVTSSGGGHDLGSGDGDLGDGDRGDGVAGGDDPWGAVAGGTLGRVGLGAFGELDLGGLTWLRNRLYDPASRTMVARDPLPGVPSMPVATNPYHYANNDPVGFVDPLGLQPLSIDQYNEIREQETGMQWGNVAMVGLMAASFFVPGGPIIATLVGAGMGMAPGIIQGVTTGNWDAGSIIKGAVVGGVAGRVGFAFGGASSSVSTAMLRGAAGGAASGTVGEAYDMLPLPGSDGQFDLETVALDTVIGGATGRMGYRPSADVPTLPQGLTQAQFDDLGTVVRSGAGHISDDIAAHGSRATYTARPDSDIDIAVRVDPDRFQGLVSERFGTPNPGSAKERTMQHAIETGKIQAGEAGLRGVRRNAESAIDMDVDLSVIERGGAFDQGPYIQLPGGP
jgi:RHS repeat-associated protein